MYAERENDTTLAEDETVALSKIQKVYRKKMG